MKVKRYVGAANSLVLEQDERKRLAELVLRFVPQADHVNIVASSDGPICEVRIPSRSGGAPEIRVGRVDAVVPGDLL